MTMTGANDSDWTMTVMTVPMAWYTQKPLCCIVKWQNSFSIVLLQEFPYLTVSKETGKLPELPDYC